MNIMFLLIGVGLGFFVAACLIFSVIHMAIRQSDKYKAQRASTDVTLLEQQRRIMLATEKIAAMARFI